MRRISALAAIALVSLGARSAAAENQEQPDDDVEQAAGAYRWHTPAGSYRDPTSLYSLHGYVEGVFAAPSDDWIAPDSTQLSAPGQLLVPATDKSSFQFDGALVLGSQLGDAADLMLELQLLSDPSAVGAAGPGGLTVAVNEASVSVDVVEDKLSVAGGIFWAPFGIVNQDWLGAQALFSVLPRASGAFPTHWNERGVRLSGAFPIDDNYGVNYVAAVGNGLSRPDIAGQTSFDLNNDKSYMARIGLFPGLGEKIEIGYSIASTRFRNAADLMSGVSDPLRYPSRMLVNGIDAVVKHEKFMLRSYYIFSVETLDEVQGVAPPNLSRHGAMMEAVYDFAIDNKWVAGLAPKGRADFVSVQTLDATGTSTVLGQTGVLSVGVNVYPGRQAISSEQYPFRSVYLSLEYHVQRELEGDDLDNDRFVARLAGRF